MGITLRWAAAVMLPMLGSFLPSKPAHLPDAPLASAALADKPPLHSAFLAGAVGENCGAGKDMVVQALELLKADSNKSDLTDAVEHLKRAADMCSESVEAWYYRSLVEDKLGHKPQADFAMRQAHKFGSEALTEQLNPFILATPKNAEPLKPIQDRWALVIGVGAFADTSIEALQFTRSDAESFRDALTDAKDGAGFKPDHVRMVVNDTATLRGVKEALNWLARSAQPDDLAVVYIASHGSARELDTAGANYILTHDTDTGRTKPDADVDPDKLYATALPMVELANAVATRLKARRSAVFIDTCYSGGVATGGKLPPPSKLLAPGIAQASVSKRTLEQIRQGTGRIILSASRTEQESYESEKLQHGYFTYYLVKTLREHPEMPLTQIFASMQQQVSAGVDGDSDLALRGLHQNPVMSRSDDDADFALGPAESQQALSNTPQRDKTVGSQTEASKSADKGDYQGSDPTKGADNDRPLTFPASIGQQSSGNSPQLLHVSEQSQTASRQSLTSATYSGCVMQNPHLSTSYLFSTADRCLVLNGEYDLLKAAGHEVVFRGTITEASGNKTPSLHVQSLVEVRAACSHVCTLPPPAHRGLQSRAPGFQTSDPKKGADNANPCTFPCPATKTPPASGNPH